MLIGGGVKRLYTKFYDDRLRFWIFSPLTSDLKPDTYCLNIAPPNQIFRLYPPMRDEICDFYPSLSDKFADFLPSLSDFDCFLWGIEGGKGLLGATYRVGEMVSRHPLECNVDTDIC